MTIFRFKQFSVKNERSAMKVNTDGVLLGAAMTLEPSDRRLLDIGTGTGTIALMAAQRLSGLKSQTEDSPLAKPCSDSDFAIEAIDIDEPSVGEAAENFAASPWADSLTVKNISLQDYAAEVNGTAAVVRPAGFDLIFSNPPYFESSLKAPDERRRVARHAETMSYREITAFAAARLSDTGRLSVILPAEIEIESVRYAASFGLCLFRVLRVRTTPPRPITRVVLEFSRRRPAQGPVSEEITIQKEGAYSEEYRSLVKNYLL